MNDQDCRLSLGEVLPHKIDDGSRLQIVTGQCTSPPHPTQFLVNPCEPQQFLITTD